MISPMCQVSVGRHDTCTWVECTCWCHGVAARRAKGVEQEADEGQAQSQGETRRAGGESRP